MYIKKPSLFFFKFGSGTQENKERNDGLLRHRGGSLRVSPTVVCPREIFWDIRRQEASPRELEPEAHTELNIVACQIAREAVGARPVGPGGLPSTYDAEPPSSIAERAVCYHRCWNAVADHVDRFLTELNTTAYKSVSKFISKSFMAGGCCAGTLAMRRCGSGAHASGFLPTAIVCAGLNLSDHGHSFQHLEKELLRTCFSTRHLHLRQGLHLLQGCAPANCDAPPSRR